MFETAGGSVAGDFCVPGVPRPAAPATPPTELLALRTAVDGVLGLDLTGLPAGVALEHTRALLVQAQRLHAATLAAVAELDSRELYALDGAGSARSWLAQQPAGRTGLAGEASRLARRPLLRAALETGSVSAGTADLVASALDRLPAQVPDEQLLGVLRYAVPALLRDRGVDPELLAEIADQALAATGAGAAGASAAERLEPACVLLARHLPPTTLAAELRMLLDALLPEQLSDDTAQSWHDQSLHLTKRRGVGYDLRGRLDDTLGGLLENALLTRLPSDSTALAVLTALTSGADLAATPTEPDPFGTVGPGTPSEPAPAWTDPPVHGTPRLTRSQKLVVALATLLADLTAVTPGSGSPQPVQLTVVATLDALQGQPGVIPAQLDTRHGPVPLSTEALQRLGCDATLTAVLLDAAATPVGASGEHRHATTRQRRALRARWGSRCAVNGCTRQGVTPHHVEPWWKVHRTTLADLAPICEHHHHDVHDGHRTLRLRDGRLINDHGWTDQLPLAG